MKRILKRVLDGVAFLWSFIFGNWLSNGLVYFSCRVQTYRFKRQLSSCGRSPSVQRFNRFQGLKFVEVADDFSALDGLWLAAYSKYKSFSYEPKVIIGKGVHLSRNVHIGAINHIKLSDNVLVGSNVLICDHSHGLADDFSCPKSDLPLISKGPIFVGENVWVCDHCVILGGTSIGKNSIVAANSVVKGDFPDYSLIAGCPAKVVRSLQKDGLSHH